MFRKLIAYIKESRDELRKVIWPSRQETVRHTFLVIGVSVGVAVFLGIADYVFTIGFERFFLNI
ncbi:MAG: preprotein translocase subunit SecE [Patescibacteria group bacterium]|jgi:preprotein translocase subunit SecE